MLCSRGCKKYHRLSNGGRQPELYLSSIADERKAKAKAKAKSKTKKKSPDQAKAMEGEEVEAEPVGKKIGV